jgi:tetratricopeptide (TPR) repeat protein
LAIVYDVQYVSSPADPRFWTSALVILVLGAALGAWIRGTAVAVRSALWTVLFILPVLNLKAFNQEESLLHDRYLYLPSVGFCLLLAVMLDRVTSRSGARRRWVFAGATLLIATVYFGLTLTQNRSWKSDLAMTGQALRVSPRNAFLHNYLGAWYFEHGQLLEAQDAYERAIRIRPAYYDAYSNLADVYHVRGQFTEAERLYVRAIGLGARYPNTYFNLGVVLVNQNKLIESERPLLEAVELQPDFDKAHYNLGWIYAAQGKDRLAEQEYRRTLEVRPSYVEARVNLSALLRKEGRYDAALRELEIARRFAPDHPDVLRALDELRMQTNVP